jgi:hypothetical protein
MLVSTTYSGSQLNMTLFAPDGSQMVPGVYPVMDYSNAPYSIWYAVDSPASGVWSARVDAIDVPTNGEPYYFQVCYSNSQELVVSVSTGPSPLVSGQSVTLFANFSDGTNPITGAAVSADLLKPNGQTNHQALYDDGTHGDITPGDGIYSASYSPDVLGVYNISVTGVSGTLQRNQNLQLEVLPATRAPILNAQTAGGFLNLSWLAPSGSFLLEGTSNLLAPAWYAEDALIGTDSNYVNTAAVSISGQHFFRLRGSQ